MDSLQMDLEVARGYKSPTQIVRRLTEDWVRREMYCLECGRKDLKPQGKPLLDFMCGHCEEPYELKSGKAVFGRRITDSAYSVKIEQISQKRNPSFLLLQYERVHWRVVNLFAVPKHVFYPGLIVKRPPLKREDKRGGWVGSFILLERIPEAVRIGVIENQRWVRKEIVSSRWRSMQGFLELAPQMRGWTLDVYRVVGSLGQREFSLHEVYEFADELQRIHPKNRHVEEKIRQQLQNLRNMGLLRFKGNGRYRIHRYV